jgi:hypothetical protein
MPESRTRTRTRRCRLRHHCRRLRGRPPGQTLCAHKRTGTRACCVPEEQRSNPSRMDELASLVRGIVNEALEQTPIGRRYRKSKGTTGGPKRVQFARWKPLLLPLTMPVGRYRACFNHRHGTEKNESRTRKKVRGELVICGRRPAEQGTQAGRRREGKCRLQKARAGAGGWR